MPYSAVDLCYSRRGSTENTLWLLLGSVLAEVFSQPGTFLLNIRSTLGRLVMVVRVEPSGAASGAAPHARTWV